MRWDFKESLAAVQRINCHDARVETRTPFSMSDAGGLGHRMCSGGGRVIGWGYILKVKLVEFADGLDVDVKRRRVKELFNSLCFHRKSKS